MKRLAAVRAALAAAGEPEPKGGPLASYELTQGSPAMLEFYRRAFEADYQQVYIEAWPTDAGELATDHVYRAASLGDEEAIYEIDGALVYAYLSHGDLRLKIASMTREGIADAVSSFRNLYPFAAAPTDDLVPVTFWSYGRMGPQTHTRRISVAPWDEITGNYTNDVRSDLANLMDGFEPGKGGQLLLWQGPPGTGKTWALRALASQWREWAEVHYITDPDAFFGEHAGEYMTEVLLREAWSFDSADGDAEEKWRLLVLEDTGELLSADAKEKSGQALSRLLNVVDGLIGQGLRVLVLVTTNDSIETFHPAVARPGRCASAITFAPLTAEEAAEWLNADPEKVEAGGTLAELYALGARLRGDAEPETNELVAATVASLAEAETRTRMLQAAPLPKGAEVMADGSIRLLTTTTPEELQMLADALAPVIDRRPEPQPGAEAEIDVPEQRTDAAEIRWTATLMVEDQLTEDGRYIAPGAVRWRELPLTLMAQLTTPETGGHALAQVAGRIDRIYRQGNLILGEGVFDDGEFGQEVARLVSNQTLRGNSVDLAIIEFEIAPRSDFDDSGRRISETEVDPMDILTDDPTDRPVFVVNDAVIGSSTLVSFPALAGAEIAVTASGMRADARRQSGIVLVCSKPEEVEEGDSLIASIETEEDAITASVSPPVAPPHAWFANPEFEGLTALTVTEEGQIFGHAAAWNTCHIGIPDVCTTAPISEANYAYYLLGEVETAEGDLVSVGKITLDTGHAAKHLGRQAAAAHYDNTGTVVADVVVGEDEFGIWVAGALRSDVSPEQVRAIRSSSLSGDWRGVNGHLELVALLAVNVPGFPVPRALVAAGEGVEPEVISLVAAGVVNRAALSERERTQLAALAAVADGGLAAISEFAA